MRRRSGEEAFISLMALQVFVVIALILVTVQIGRTTFMARRVQIEMMQEQLHWLAESAVQQAVAGITLDASPQLDLTLAIAPVYIDTDPLLSPEELDGGSLRVIQANYGYRRESLTREQVPERFRPDTGNVYRVSAYSEAKYRDEIMRYELIKLCIPTQAGAWRVIPVVEGK